MRITKRTQIVCPFRDTFSNLLDQKFRNLIPFSTSVRVSSHEGSEIGDATFLEFTRPAHSVMEVRVKDRSVSDHVCLLIDEAVKPPFNLKYWKHYIWVKEREGDSSEIIDQITFGCKSRWQEPFYAFLIGQLLRMRMRKYDVIAHVRARRAFAA